MNQHENDDRGWSHGKPGNFWRVLEERLESLGVDLEARLHTLGVDLQELEDSLTEGFKVVCVTPDLGESVREMGESPREHTVMVRVDEETRRKLDAWVETGAVKSRSEAAALFIREGLHVRSDELAELEDALTRVEQARARLREKARTVFGDYDDDTGAAR
jgi:Arc/MetJ-type ribon-helix-helix transcriptional regulator